MLDQPEQGLHDLRYALKIEDGTSFIASVKAIVARELREQPCPPPTTSQIRAAWQRDVELSRPPQPPTSDVDDDDTALLVLTTGLQTAYLSSPSFPRVDNFFEEDPHEHGYQPSLLAKSDQFSEDDAERRNEDEGGRLEEGNSGGLRLCVPRMTPPSGPVATDADVLLRFLVRDDDNDDDDEAPIQVGDAAINSDDDDQASLAATSSDLQDGGEDVFIATLARLSQPHQQQPSSVESSSDHVSAFCYTSSSNLACRGNVALPLGISASSCFLPANPTG